MTELSSRVAVITGAFGSLGSAVAITLAKSGARVALLDVAPRPPPALAQQFVTPHLLIGGVQITDESKTIEAMAAVVRQLGRIDVLVNVAGGFRWEKIADGSVDTWDLMYGMNLKTALVASCAALPHLLATAPGSCIVNIGAGAASKPAAAGMGAYTASKAGVQKLTESLADELKDRGITVNAILPGTIDTPQNRKDMPDADFSRWVAPSAIAEVVLFLASSRASAVTGAAIPVNGRG
jgi:NAD(P)-dependent dehydrogenase (short-subunit alcohol dehydrogenase family)